MLIDNWFDCMDGDKISMELVNDGNEDCSMGEDEGDNDGETDMTMIMALFNESDADGDGLLSATEFSTFYSNINSDGPPSVEVFFAMMDSDGDELITASEFSDWSNNSRNDGSEPMSEEDWKDFEAMFNNMDLNSDGGWNITEFSAWNDAQENSDDGHGDHGDHGSHGGAPLDWVVIQSEDLMMELPPIAGDLSQYYAILSNCTFDDSGDSDDMMGMGGASEMTCGTDVVFVPLSNAGMGSDIMFHDVDNSGTLTYGDMLHVSPNATGDWNHVRLYSTTADAYSDENPMMTPGFTGVIGMIALLGAALLTRRD